MPGKNSLASLLLPCRGGMQMIRRWMSPRSSAMQPRYDEPVVIPRQELRPEVAGEVQQVAARLLLCGELKHQFRSDCAARSRSACVGWATGMALGAGGSGAGGAIALASICSSACDRRSALW